MLKDKFIQSICLLIILLITIAFLFYFQIDIPLAMVYPYLLMNTYYALINKRINLWINGVYIIPILIVLALYLLSFMDDFSFKPYFNFIFYTLHTLFLLGTSVAIIIAIYIRKSDEAIIKNRGLILTTFLSIQGIIISILIAYLYLHYVENGLSLSKELSYTIFGILILTICVLIKYYFYFLYINKKGEKEINKCRHCGKHSDELASNLEKMMIEKSLFLNKNLNREILAKELGITEHCLSELLNNALGCNFYTYLAKKRIDYCIKTYNQSKNSLTIEAVAYECGFNSVNSFNKYFKEFVGCTFSEYKKTKI